jgi:hypothetical protein
VGSYSQQMLMTEERANVKIVGKSLVVISVKYHKVAMAQKNNNDWGLFTVIFGLLFGVGMGIKHVFDKNSEINKLSEIIIELRSKGFSDEKILQAAYDDASEKLGGLSKGDKNRMVSAFIKAKNIADQKKVETKR